MQPEVASLYPKLLRQEARHKLMIPGSVMQPEVASGYRE